MLRILSHAAAIALLAATATRAGDDPPKADAKSGIDKSNFDTTVRPQDDLFRHVNGAWLESTEIPGERASYGAFIQLVDEAEADVRAIIEEVAESDSPDGSEARKIRDLYRSFLDEQKVEELGLEPIAEDLAKVDAVADKAAFLDLMAELQTVGVPGLFAAFVNTDDKNSDEYILNLYQGGLGLPDESYYRDEKFAPVRDQYVDHIAKMFELAGLPEPADSARAIMAVETDLAKSHWDRVKSRDDSLTYNKKDRDGLTELTPGFNWPRYFEAVGAGDVQAVVVRQPSYFTAMAEAVEELPLDQLKLWLTWKVLSDSAPLLSSKFVEEDFNFSGKALTGTEEIRPRWKRAVSAVQGAMGEAVGRLYVERHFPPEAKARMEELVANLIEAYRQDINELEWMSPETRSRAIEKLEAFTPKIGYPDKWRDYSKLQIMPGDLVGNMRRAAEFEIDRQLAKLGGPVDRSEWGMTPQTVNAYYNPGFNEIVFPAAILQPPFFDMEADDAVNYGGIGAVIGHEIGHGFDDQGSKYDGEGNMKDWWTEADRSEFDTRAEKLIAQYSGFEPAQLPGQHINGALTIGENIGDLGGLTIAQKAYKIALDGKEPPVLDGLTGEQRLFYGWAQVWRIKFRDQELARRLAIDPHSPGEFRCNGIPPNMPAFYEAFGVKEGDGMYLPPEDRVSIW